MSIGKAGKDVLVQIKQIWSQYAGHLEKTIMPLWDEAEKAIERMWRENFHILATFVDYLKDTYETIMHAIEGNVEALEKKIRAVGIIRKMNQWYKDYAAWIEELPIQHYIDDARQLIHNK